MYGILEREVCSVNNRSDMELTMNESQFGESYLKFKQVFFGQCNSMLLNPANPDKQNKCVLYREHEGKHVYESD